MLLAVLLATFIVLLIGPRRALRVRRLGVLGMLGLLVSCAIDGLIGCNYILLIMCGVLDWGRHLG